MPIFFKLEKTKSVLTHLFLNLLLLLDGKKNVKREVVEDENEDQERVYLENDSNSKGTSEDISLQVSPVLIMVFVCMMCLMLLLLYFFFDKLGELSIHLCLHFSILYLKELCI